MSEPLNHAAAFFETNCRARHCQTSTNVGRLIHESSLDAATVHLVLSHQEDKEGIKKISNNYC